MASFWNSLGFLSWSHGDGEEAAAGLQRHVAGSIWNPCMLPGMTHKVTHRNNHSNTIWSTATVTPTLWRRHPRLCQVTQLAAATGWNDEAGIKAWASGSHSAGGQSHQKARGTIRKAEFFQGRSKQASNTLTQMMVGS